jgi:hypothetical protein
MKQRQTTSKASESKPTSTPGETVDLRAIPVPELQAMQYVSYHLKLMFKP